MADTLVLEASAERRASSSLAGGTKHLRYCAGSTELNFNQQNSRGISLIGKTLALHA